MPIETPWRWSAAWATAAAGYWAVTAEIRVRFRRALQVGEPTTVKSKIMSIRERLITTEAALASDIDGAAIASATATFMRFDRETEEAWRTRYLRPEKRQPDTGGQ